MISKIKGEFEGLDIRVDITKVNIDLLERCITVSYNVNYVTKSGTFVGLKTNGSFSRSGDQFDKLVASDIGKGITALLENDLTNIEI